MKVGIIGAGNIGGNLARRLTSLGHDVAIANSRGPHTLSELVAETGVKPVEIREAVRDADIIIVTIPQKNIPNLPADLFAKVPSHAVIVETGNYYPQQRDGRIEEIEVGMSESRWVERHLGRAVIKAFNGIRADNLLVRGRPAGSPDRIALPVAGDNATTKAVVMKLIDELGFDPVDAGGLDESWRQQPGTPSYGAEVGPEELRNLLEKASPIRTAEWRA